MTEDTDKLECSNPNWSNNCNGTLETEHGRKKGLCQGCRDVISSWSEETDDNQDDCTEQTTLVTDGGFHLDGTDRCSACGRTSDETNLGYSEAREDFVCSRCVVFLGEHGHYPDEDGPGRSVTVEYEVQGRN